MALILFVVLARRGGKAAAMNGSFIVSVLSGSILSATSVLYATLSKVIGQRAGVVNLGVEGVMLMGAVTGFATAVWTGSAALGFWPGPWRAVSST